VINLSYQYKLKLTQRQIQEINQIIEICRSVYNYALKERKDWLNSRKYPVNACSIFQEYIIPAGAPYPNYNTQAKNLTQARKNNELLNSVHSQVLQQTLKTLEAAFAEMKSRGFGFPRFKKKMKSFLFPQLSANCLGSGTIKLPSLGQVRIRQSREYPIGFVAK
jgi:putative transposase